MNLRVKCNGVSKITYLHLASTPALPRFPLRLLDSSLEYSMVPARCLARSILGIKAPGRIAARAGIGQCEDTER